jgi:hypothetical protein
MNGDEIKKRIRSQVDGRCGTQVIYSSIFLFLASNSNNNTTTIRKRKTGDGQRVNPEVNEWLESNQRDTIVQQHKTREKGKVKRSRRWKGSRAIWKRGKVDFLKEAPRGISLTVFTSHLSFPPSPSIFIRTSMRIILDC